MQDPVIADLNYWIREQEFIEMGYYQYCMELHQYYGLLSSDFQIKNHRDEIGDCSDCPLRWECGEFQNRFGYDIRCESFSPSQEETDWYEGDEQYYSPE